MWKDIKGYEGIYQVSDEGKVRRILQGGITRELKNRPSANYYTVSLSNKCNKKTFAVHRLVAETFLERKPEQTEVNHKDGNKLNNRLENLEWVTQKENMQHAMYELGIAPFGKPARKVNRIDPVTNDVLAEYKSVTDASRFIGKSSARASITLCCQGLQNSAYGYRWEYGD